ncbi:nitrous oxide reductase accessory protein NosL [Sulfurospirillum sp. 1612]|uniref:nitrous oxide reductase accessory protein NosL n=1 Tax=Sulfurospirillum sp. 1612 TaxID=3094835 RepID=UPI002F92716E
MKKVLILAILLCATHVFAQFSKVATHTPVLVQEAHNPWCPITGQSIKENYKTSLIARLQTNARARQYSALSALAIDMQEYGIDTKSIQALDVISQKYINANSAFFLINSQIKPTFGTISAIAFAKKADADSYRKTYGGDVVSFEEALKKVTQNLKKSIAYMKKIYKKKTYKMGERIYKKKCQEIDPTDYIEINDLKKEIVDQHLCGTLNERYLQALALYLWNVKRAGDLGENEERVKVNEDEKCPVCGMFTYKYPRWAAQIFFKHKDHEHHYSFDGVKDMMKFYFNPSKWGKYDFVTHDNITKMLVTDYYSQKGIDARSAYFVEGSDIYGPMGHELIPFSTQDEAENFKKDHKGTRILTFDQIKESEVYDLDNR